jgi:hypothetical protein
VSVRVGQAVDVVGQAGRPKTITGFATHTTPVLLAYEQVGWICCELQFTINMLNLSTAEGGTGNRSIHPSHLHLGGICYSQGKSKLQAGCVKDAKEGENQAIQFKAVVSDSCYLCRRTTAFIRSKMRI